MSERRRFTRTTALNIATTPNSGSVGSILLECAKTRRQGTVVGDRLTLHARVALTRVVLVAQEPNLNH